MHSIYVITAPDGRAYVGRTSGFPSARFEKHARDSSPIGVAIRKFGRDAMKLEVLKSDVPANEIIALEEHTISDLRTVVPHGFNRSESGGKRAVHEGKSITLNLRTTAAVKQMVDALAKEDERSIAQIVERLIKAAYRESGLDVEDLM